MLDGELVLIEDGGETLLKPGDAAGFKAGVPNGHQLVNRSQRDALYLEIGTRAASERAQYPDVDLVLERDARGMRFLHKSGEPYPQRSPSTMSTTCMTSSIDIDADGIALVTWDMPGRSMNVIDLKVMEELAGDRRKGRGRRRDQGRGHHLRQGHVLRRRRPHHARNAEPRIRRRRPRARRGERRSGASIEESRGCRSSSAGSKPAASRGSRRSTARRSAAASSWPRLPPPHRRRQSEDRGSACPRSRSACFPAPAARSASRA